MNFLLFKILEFFQTFLNFFWIFLDFFGFLEIKKSSFYCVLTWQQSDVSPRCACVCTRVCVCVPECD